MHWMAYSHENKVTRGHECEQKERDEKAKKRDNK
jgi:hypothetical protein